MTKQANITPRRDTLRPRHVKTEESDVDRAHRLLAEIVSEHGPGDRYRFTEALAVRLHGMRLTPSTLLTSDGFDAIVAVATALDDWRELKQSAARTLPKVWLTAVRAVGGRPPALPGPVRNTPRYFTNNIRIR